ncbi:hypothetical protein ACRHK7_05750 [Weissella tructae]|uniref:Uncharacterized protein n=2 Tax=Weissella TaxID=46255 RepID=A0A075U0C3_9LACO|nr:MULTISPECIES: hypothetical protein [Weissella]AIG65653.1 hypothetical protein WS08_0714 [Weissella tructae]AIM62968.1 hypothetical protein WS74_0716 [Weissella ceti]AIM64366.1 hypothetical protein WS105_0776 [Weissella ceti]ELA06893.1 hypothetical protein WCNC_04917 [Weissella ceti NC36]QVV90775.1 hypothetical protein KHQ32_03830 [Weissella tructae]
MPREKNTWLGFVGMGIAFFGMIAVMIPSGIWALNLVGYVLLTAGVAMSAIGMIINRKNNHVVALIATLLTVLMFNGAVMAQFAFEGVRMGVLESGLDEEPYEDEDVDVDVVGMNKAVTSDDIAFEAVSFKQQKDHYRTIEITLTNTGKDAAEYSVDNLMIAEKYDGEWLFVDALNRKTSMSAVEDKHFKFLEDGILNPGETIKKTLVYESDNNQDYLLVPMDGTDVAAIKLKH